MTYEVFVTCDQCGAREQVQQLNAVPKNWIQMMYAKPGQLKLDRNLIAQQTQPLEPIGKLFCGWRCVVKFSKDQLNGTE